MSWQHTIYVYPILFTTVVSLFLAVYASQYSRHHGRKATVLIFAAMNVAIALWTGFSAIKLLSTDPAVQFQAYRLLYFGSSSVGPLLLLFVMAYTDHTWWLRRPIILGVFVVPITFWLLLFTNPYDIVIVDIRVIETEGLTIMRTTTGPAHVALSFIYAAIIAIVTLGVIGFETLRRGRSFLPQAALLALAIVTPMLVSLLTSAGVPPFGQDNVNFVPASTIVSSGAIGFATFRYRLLDLQPIAYRTVVDNSPDGVLVLNQDERVVHTNETIRSLLGSETPGVGESITALREQFGVSTESNTVIELPAETGTAEFLDVRSQQLRRGEELVGWVLVFRDVSDRRRRERELESFTSVISHDLRKPLRTTEQYLDLFEQEINIGDEEAHELLAVARRNSQQMQEMITDLLEYSRIDAESIEFEPVDCDELVADVIETMRFEIEDRNATVEVDDLPTVHGIDHLLRRLFQNLLGNALQHGDADTPEIHVGATHEGGYWRFTVRDNGAGIKPGEKDYVFDLFTQGHRADPDAGTGMGLAICERIVRRHEGAIEISSDVEDGTEVVFTIPDS